MAFFVMRSPFWGPIEFLIYKQMSNVAEILALSSRDYLSEFSLHLQS